MLAALSQVRERDDSRRARTAALRRRLLAHSRAKIHAQGYFGCSLRELADEASTTPTAIMRLFGSKDGLLHAIRDDSFATALGWLEDVRAASAGEELVRAVVHVLAEAERDPHVGDFLIAGADLSFVLGRTRVGPRPSGLLVHERSFSSWFHERAAACIEAGLAPGVRAPALAEATIGVLERFLLNAYLHRRTRGGRYLYAVDDAAVETVVGLMLDPASVPAQRYRRRSSFRHVSRLDGWRDGTSDRLVAAAWVELATRGYGDSTTASISRGARTSESELFRRFRNGKFDLLHAVCERCYTFVLADLEQLPGRGASALLDAAMLLWSLGDSQPTLVELLLANAGNATSLLVMPRELMTPDDQTALTGATDAFVLWFLGRAREATPPTATHELGTACGQAALGIAERMLMLRHRDQHGLRHDEAIAPLERIVTGLGRVAPSALRRRGQLAPVG
jgi:AcrR family transcriptional regulator